MTLLQYGPLAAQEQEWEPLYTQATSCASSIEVASVPESTGRELESQSFPGLIGLQGIESSGRVFMLRKGLVAHLMREGSVWSCQVADLHLMGYGYSVQQAVSGLMEDFAASYDGLTHEPDHALTEDARQLRDAIVRLVTRVVHGTDVPLQSSQTTVLVKSAT